MPFAKFKPADGWRDADARSPSLHSRRAHALALLVAVAALAATAGLKAVDDPQPLDVQLSAALHQAGGTLAGWHGQLSRGLQVSLRAVADGRDLAPGEAAVMAQALPVAQPVVDADDRDQPVATDASLRPAPHATR